MKFSMLNIVIVITVSFVFSVITTENLGFLVQFLVSLGLFVLIGLFATVALMKKTKLKK